MLVVLQTGRLPRDILRREKADAGTHSLCLKTLRGFSVQT